MFTRRDFIRLSAAAAATAAVPLRIHGQTAKNPATSTAPSRPEQLQAGSVKKGLGLGSRNPLWPRLLTDLECKWCYTWTAVLPPDLPEGLQFVPMIRSKQATAEKITRIANEAKAAGLTGLLGLNEPDARSQDDMTVGQALEMWPLLMETGMRLGSPGCVHPDNPWMKEFMTGVEERGLRVDFVCVHSYGGPNPQALVNKLAKTLQLYDRPLWITEFGVGDWKAKEVGENEHGPEAVLRFMDNVLPMLEELDYLERYAWFPARPESGPLGTSALFDAEGELTPLGERYRDA